MIVPFYYQPSTANEMNAAAAINSGKKPVNCRTKTARGRTIGVGTVFLPHWCCNLVTWAVVRPVSVLMSVSK